MRFVFDIRCDREDHQLELLPDGTMVPLNHNLEMISAFVAFGASKPQCLMVVDDWRRGAAHFFKGDPWTREFNEAFWEQYEEFEGGPGELLPLEFLPKDKFVETLIYLLRYNIEDGDWEGSQKLAEAIYEEIDPKEDVELKRDVNYDDESYSSSAAYDNRALEIKGIEVAKWTLATERRVYDPFGFTSNVEEMEIDGEAGETPWPVREALEALHIEEPEAAEPSEPVDIKECPEGQECDYAVVYIGEFGDYYRTFYVVVQYEDIWKAKEALETHTYIISEWGSRDKDDIASVAVRRKGKDLEEFQELVRRFDFALSQQSLFPDVGLEPELQALSDMTEEELAIHRVWKLVDEDEVERLTDEAFYKEYGYHRPGARRRY